MSRSWVRDVLTYRVSVDLDPNQRHPLDVVMGTWSDVSRRSALTEEFVALLVDPDPKLRAAALHFFSATMAEDRGALVDAYEHHLGSYEHVPRHWYPGEGDLRDLLVLAITKRMLPASRALELMKHEVLRPGHGGYAVLGVLATDPTWLRRHVIEVVTGSPDALPAILLNLGAIGVAPDNLVRDLKGHVVDEVLLKAIGTALPKDRERLAALVVARPISEPRMPSGPTAGADGLAAGGVRPVHSGLGAVRATERLEAIRDAALDHRAVGDLAALRNQPLEGCTDLSGLFPAEIAGDELIYKVQWEISNACLEALVSIADSEEGMDSLIEAAAVMTSQGRRSQVTLALRKTNPARLAHVLRSRLALTGHPASIALMAIGAIAQDFDLSAAAVGRYLPNPPEVPEVLTLLRDDLSRMTDDLTGLPPQLACAMDVIGTYSRVQGRRKEAS